ncbi:4Fe-4S dicluster domain-containing protein [Pararhodobacter aggregans]|uniref:NAD-binding oxidoreductase n=1 Tax=Pararhodobacter aggregans TaxID=404875 RepID=A0A2T7UXN5_9RHOB|nr:4Fe-4S double cluster binding domain-containing protein [Pararhodobacter aggregans]PTX05255.1 reductive dehalogenase [Pararhodobacter aggregans]PVE49550.1 NAD-binding oxidoreductase [Pararhodobacter aggregans]
MPLFAHADRPVHLGPFPLERLRRGGGVSLEGLPFSQPLRFDHPDPHSLAHAMARYQTMFDTVRQGPVVHEAAGIPDDPVERSNHLKAAGYYFDASMMGVCRLEPAHHLPEPHRNPMIDALREELERGQPKTHAAGIDAIYADILDAARSPHGPVTHHRFALLIAVGYTRDPGQGEPGCDWLHGTQAERAALLANNTAVVLSSYLRMLGHEARAHSMSTSEVDLPRLAVSSGLAFVDGGAAVSPYLGTRYGLAAVTTTLELAPDQPLDGDGRSARSHGPGWWSGAAAPRRAATAEPFAHREFRKGPYPFERLKRVEEPTTLIDHARVPRFPKRADFFARALYGDMGKSVQEGAKGGRYVAKSPIGACARRALGALLLLQFGDARGPESAPDPERNAENLKAAGYYLSADAVGLCAVPDWAYYSHNSAGEALQPYHRNAVNMLFDQGHETMEGASGDDWISVAQSMRAYLRFSLLGGVVAEQIRRLGYSARVHSVLDGDVLQPPLLLLSGLGEVSRIGEVILNPYLGPRLKSGSVTTDMPMAADKPIDFGLQTFCNACNKCARECPSGAITAGPKLMYNGYEIWKSDAEKCARYRITNQAGGMCGRCMKTCPWNLQGLFAEAPFRWLAMNAPGSAKALAALDDRLGRGAINPVKAWWWDIELDKAGKRYVPAAQTNRRDLNRDLDLKYEDQTLAVYPADVMPQPFPITQPLNREEGIARYRAMLTPEEYRNRLARGQTEGLVPGTRPPEAPPVFPVLIARREDLSDDTMRFELTRADGQPLPPFEAGAHVALMIAPEYQRDYSLAGNPADSTKYVLGIQKEAAGRGGSLLIHRVFREGRRVFVTPPSNLFPLDEAAPFTLLIGGGIGVTPMLTMAHRLHALGRDFRLHYLARGTAPFGAEIAAAPWAGHAQTHVKTDGPRVDLATLIPPYTPGAKLYTCGGGGFMDGVFDTARAQGWPEDALSREYFAVPEAPDWVNHPFTLRLTQSRRDVPVAADQSATEALAAVGITIPTKCSDGICGVCAVTHQTPEGIEHRDYVLSAKERENRVILCCSRARDAAGVLTLDL